jgi:hypothetical protein
MPFTVLCRCGQALHGDRQRRSQVLPCPGCRRPVFIFPRSPFPDRPGQPATPTDNRSPSARIARWLTPWRRPLVAGLITLLLLGLGFWLLLPYLSRPLPAASEDVQGPLDTARRALREGSFHRALELLDTAVRARDRRPDALTSEENHTLDRLHRQAQLLDRLLSRPLQDLLREAGSIRREEEWQRHFEREYRGRTVIFDDEVGLDGGGRPELRFYEVRAGDETARVAVSDLTVLSHLPLQPPRRLLFGGRLASFARDEDGVWVIGFEPDSGVLLTDEDVLAAWRPPLVNDELREVLNRQAIWLRDLSP